MKFNSIHGYLVGAVIWMAGVMTLYGRPVKTNGDDTYRETLKDSISWAIDYQLSHYPASQYRDIYKNFMQDFFGPGHILVDTTASGIYLRKELNSKDKFEGPLYEKTGYKGNFYRVNLSLIRDGIISYEVFFKNFIESVRGIEPPSGTEWMRTWNIIDEVIKEKGIGFPNEIADREEMTQQFQEGDYIVHHSDSFNESTHFHYRIISSALFEKELLPLIEQSNPDSFHN